MADAGGSGWSRDERGDQGGHGWSGSTWGDPGGWPGAEGDAGESRASVEPGDAGESRASVEPVETSPRRIGQLVAALLLVVLAAIGVFLVRGWLSGDDDEAARPGPVPTPTAPGPSVETKIPAGAVASRVTKIVDGDTLDTPLGRIRLYGIDTPEVGEAYAPEATAALAEQVPVGSAVWLWRPPGGDDTDQYGRLVRIVLRPDGTEVNRTLVAAGLARAYRTYSERYVPDENRAREAGLGIWSPALVSTGPTTRAHLNPVSWGRA